MVQCAAASLRLEDTFGVQLERPLVRFDGDRDWSICNGRFEGLLSGIDIHVTRDASSFQSNCAAGLRAGSCPPLVAVSVLGTDTLGGLQILESGVHQATLTSCAS